jgi:predicted transcriptional regulator of viral defense system
MVYASHPGFDKNNLSYWTKKRLLIRLRNGYYCFPEYLTVPNFFLYIANYIYKPSYISLHTALAFYAVIPESVVQITSITSLKTASFTNDFGEFSFHSILPEFMFGYDSRPLADGRSILIARPEKALLDFLYLYPFYNSENELSELRLDDDFMHNDLNVELLRSYTQTFHNKALHRRVELLMKTYSL